MKKNISRTSILVLTLLFSFILAGCGENENSDIGMGDAVATTEAVADDAVYQVTLDPNGGVFADGTSDVVTIDVNGGTPVDFQSYMPSMEGNDLAGWYQADNSPWPGARKVSENISIKARWSEEVIQEVYPFEITLKGETVPLSSDSGVYQFTVVSSIHAGYAQRSGLYTVYLDELEAAIDADDGTTKRALVKFGSNYVDATGSVYGIIFNDGTLELYYNYMWDGAQVEYEMDTAYWTLEGYTAPFEPETESETEGESAHADYDKSFLPAEETSEGSEEETTEGTEGTTADIVTFPSGLIATYDATESETMKLRFFSNGVATLYMTSYETDTETKYLWSYDEENGLVLNYNGGSENVVTIAEDGDTCTVVGAYENEYQFSLQELLEAIPERTEIIRAGATNSETMFAFFYPDNGVGIMFDLTSYGQEGQFHTTASGQWSYDEESGLQIAINGALVELAENADGNLEFTVDGNTYALSLSELLDSVN